jgi:large subunit ribosomal protein L24
MSKLKLKIGVKVRVKVGKDKGREGKIEKILPKKLFAVIPTLNIYKKHVKGTQGQKGGIYEIPRPIDFSKLSLVCPKCGKESRVGFKISAGTKVRVCKKCGKNIDSIRGKKNK